MLTMLLGGGPTVPSLPFAALFLAGIALLAWVLLNDGAATFLRAPLLVRGSVVALFLLPLLQLTPLPNGLGQHAPGRATANAVRMLAGGAGEWLPLTLVPHVTVQVVFSLALLLGFFLAVLRTDTRAAAMLVGVVLALEVLTLVVGALQLTSGGTMFNFYGSKHRFNLIGFFANRNHAAVFLACSIPFGVALLATAGRQPRQLFAAGALIALATLVTTLGTVSRAGLVLVVLGYALSLVLLGEVTKGRAKWALGSMVAGAVFSALLFANATVAAVFDRYADVGDDLRWTFFARTWRLAQDLLPWGGGLGSFLALYTAGERLGDVKPTIVNNAHNDYLELLLEAGVPGLCVAALLIVTVAWCGWRVARQARSADRTLGLAGLIVCILFLLHSAVDYPLRRLACAAVFTLAFALLVRPLLRRPIA